MNRGLPIALLALFFMYLAANFSMVWIWAIAAVSFFMLLALIVFMYLKGQYVGPGTLVDDAAAIRDRFIDSDGNRSAIELSDQENLADPEIRRTRS